MSLSEKYKQRLEELGASPKKSLGQNFLVNEKVIEDILSAARRAKAKQMFEIGPGLGALTDDLRQMESEFSVVELDSTFSKYWGEQGINVIEGDALKVNWSELVTSQPASLVSNLPYQISSSLVVELSLKQVPFQNMVLMFQKEVAQRIMAESGIKAYGVLSVIAQLCWDVETLCDAGPGSFYPPPKVSSRVLTFSRKPWDQEFSAEKFFLFVKSAFAQRRKKILKSLRSRPYGLEHSDEKVAAALEAIGQNTDIRAEKLSPTEFLEIYSRL